MLGGSRQWNVVRVLCIGIATGPDPPFCGSDLGAEPCDVPHFRPDIVEQLWLPLVFNQQQSAGCERLDRRDDRQKGVGRGRRIQT